MQETCKKKCPNVFYQQTSHSVVFDDRIFDLGTYYHTVNTRHPDEIDIITEKLKNLHIGKRRITPNMNGLHEAHIKFLLTLCDFVRELKKEDLVQCPKCLEYHCVQKFGRDLIKADPLFHEGIVKRMLKDGRYFADMLPSHYKRCMEYFFIRLTGPYTVDNVDQEWFQEMNDFSNNMAKELRNDKYYIRLLKLTRNFHSVFKK